MEPTGGGNRDEENRNSEPPVGCGLGHQRKQRAENFQRTKRWWRRWSAPFSQVEGLRGPTRHIDGVRRWKESVDANTLISNTTGMKAAVSIPDDVFEQGERLARRMHTSRSQLYARALADFVVQHEEDKITSAMDQVLDDVGSEVDEFTRRAARRTLRHVEW